MSNLTPFKINTSKNSCAFRISLISGQLKSSIINTSVNFVFKLPIINTSKKTGGGGPVATPVATGDERFTRVRTRSGRARFLRQAGSR